MSFLVIQFAFSGGIYRSEKIRARTTPIAPAIANSVGGASYNSPNKCGLSFFRGKRRGFSTL